MSTPTAKSTPSTARGAKSKQSSKVLVVLKLSATHLAKFPHEKAFKPESAKASSPSLSATQDSPPASEVKTEAKNEAANDDSSTNLQVPVDGRKKGNGGTVKAGAKRPISAVVDGQPKPRAKPGPKKRKLDGMPNGEESSRPWTTPAPAAGHKLGPKANQGAINAGLRALDRTGKPCRKWTKKGFSLKSFTGVLWELPSWGAPQTLAELKSEQDQDGTPTSNSENQPPQSSSNVGSETSRNLADVAENNESPAVVAATA